MTPVKSTAKPLIEVAIAASFWGFGFVNTVWALKFLDTPALIFYRFLIAFFVGGVFLLVTSSKINFKSNEFKFSAVAGFLIGITLLLQTWGLKYTTPTKSAFVTTLYVVLVPVFSAFYRRRWPNAPHLVFVAISLLGSALIVELTTAPLNFGDFLTLLNAITAAIHIIYVEYACKYTNKYFAFNIYQSFWACLTAAPFLLWSTEWNVFRMDSLGWTGLLCLSLGSTLIAFYLQVSAQKHLPAQLASILFLLESPLSYVFSFFLLGEVLSTVQLLGGAVILLACAGAVFVSTSSLTPNRQQ